MEIAPIPGIRAVQAVQPRGNGLDLPAVFAVQDSPRSGDDTYNGKKGSTGGQDDDEAELDIEDEAMDEAAHGQEDDEPEPVRTPNAPIDFFA